MRPDASPATIRDALLHVSPDLPRDEWAKVGMAIKSELGDAGAALFFEWSSRGASFDERAARQTWKSIKASGGVHVGTLFHLARQAGWKPPARVNGAKSGTATGGSKGRNPAHAPDLPAADEAAGDAERHKRGGAAAAKLWARGSEAGASPYLERKQVRNFGGRFGPGGVFYVPARDAAGELRNVQSIQPEPPADGLPEKLFVRDAPKTACWHQLGKPAGAAWLLIAEGYATAATLHEATGLPVACAFDAGNLIHVARELRKLHPQARIAIAGDDDRDTAARTGRNVGREKAAAAARAVRGAAIFPEGLAAGGSDFNDLQAVAAAEALAALPESEREGFDARAAGLETVRAQAEAALQAAEASRQGLPLDPAEKDAPEPDTQADRFRVDEAAVWYDPPDESGDGGSRPIKLCGRLRALALARDAHDGSAALLLEFDSHFGTGRRWLMPLGALAGDGVAYRAELLAMGFVPPVDPKRRGLLSLYLQTRRPKARVRLTDRTGWHGRRFVLPRETLGDDPADRLMFQSEAPVESPFSQRATLADWKHNVARLCVGNTRLAFAVATAFAGPLLALSGGVDGGGVHFGGDSSQGKTTLLRVAASIWGGADYRGSWRSTANGLESLAASHSDCTLVLDEFGQLDPREAGEAAYLLSNGVGKQRAGRTGAARPRLSWRLMTLSAGEVDLAELMAEAGRRMRAGQELRLVTVPADAGAHLGVFETLHGFDGPGELAQHLTRATEQAFGTAGRAWLEHLAANFEEVSSDLREHIDAIGREFVPEAASGQVARVGRRFALIAAAGELATAAGLTGWPAGEATHAARRCFNAWIESRPGGIGMSEDAMMLRQIRGWFALHGEARFTPWDRADDDRRPQTMNRAGWRRAIQTTSGVVETTGWEWFVLPDVFRKDVCIGFSERAALRLLKKLGHLHTESKGLTCRASPPGAHHVQVVRVRPSLLEGDDE